MEHTAALRDLKLLVGSGGLDFTKGMDSLDKHVKQISFRQCITFREHGQLKGWQPHFQPTDAKISILSISTIIAHWISLVCSSHVSQLRAQSIPCNPNLGHNHCVSLYCTYQSWKPQLRDQTQLLLCTRQVFFSYNEFGNDAKNGFLRQTCPSC